MNYEALYEKLSPLGKNLKESVNLAGRLQKTILKDAENGNLADMKKTLVLLTDALTVLQERTRAYEEAANDFDTSDYFMSGDFTQQLLEACGEKGVDVQGDQGVYEMFPYKVRIVAEAQEVYMNRKKLPTFRPSYVAETIRASQEKLNRVVFRPAPFMAELAEAYETTCLKSGARFGSSQLLTKIYKNMVPMARARKEYDMQAFAFDLARLYEAGPEAWIAGKNDKRYTFGTSRDGKTGIRVLGKTGVETYISTLSAMNE